MRICALLLATALASPAATYFLTISGLGGEPDYDQRFKMWALDIDSSLAARKELAKELGYTGDTNDSATMNIWLHKQMMAKLAANGGKLPADVKW